VWIEDSPPLPPPLPRESFRVVLITKKVFTNFGKKYKYEQKL
jgi:hypothetical protein